MDRKSRFALTLIAALGALAILPQMLRAGGLASLSGQLYDNTEGRSQLVSGARVRLISSSGQDISTTTDRNGRFAFVGLTPGDNLVAVSSQIPCLHALHVEALGATRTVIRFSGLVQAPFAGERYSVELRYQCEAQTANLETYDRYVIH